MTQSVDVRSRKHSGGIACPRRFNQPTQRNQRRSNVNCNSDQDSKRGPDKPAHEMTFFVESSRVDQVYEANTASVARRAIALASKRACTSFQTGTGTSFIQFLRQVHLSIKQRNNSDPS